MLPINNILNFSQSSALCIASFIGSIRTAAESWLGEFGMTGIESDRLEPVSVATQMYPMVNIKSDTNHKLNQGGTHSV